jgi:hypothetical protein
MTSIISDKLSEDASFSDECFLLMAGSWYRGKEKNKPSCANQRPGDLGRLGRKELVTKTTTCLPGLTGE